MSAYLLEQIQTRMSHKGLTIYGLEKKAGLNRSAVRNILQGFSKKPSADALLSIAHALECSVDDLLGPSNNNATTNIKTISKNRNLHAWNEDLYLEAVKIVTQALNEKELQLKSEQVINLINEAYKYSLDKEDDTIDADFAKWLVRQSV